jgi:hypothetical protein
MRCRFEFSWIACFVGRQVAFEIDDFSHVLLPIFNNTARAQANVDPSLRALFRRCKSRGDVFDVPASISRRESASVAESSNTRSVISEKRCRAMTLMPAPAETGLSTRSKARNVSTCSPGQPERLAGSTVPALAVRAVALAEQDGGRGPRPGTLRDALNDHPPAPVIPRPWSDA